MKKNRKVNKEEYIRLTSFAKDYNDFGSFPTVKDLADKYKCSERTINRWADSARDLGIKISLRDLRGKNLAHHYAQNETKAARENLILKDQIKALREQLEAYHTESLTNEKLLALIHGANHSDLSSKDISWMHRSNSQNEEHIPVLFLSDIHWDEVVQPAQIEYVNEYNHNIAVRRLQNVFSTMLHTCKDRFKYKYAGAVVALGGDMLSGNIHEELAETNDATILQSIITVVQTIGDGLEELAKFFGKVHVPCVVGNHGRLHKKPRYKYKVQQNFEWLVYQLLAQRFSRDARLSFDIPDSSDCAFSVFNTRFLLTHGDQFKGGSGISGIFTPLMLGASRKQKRNSAVQKSFDVLMVGHFHQYIHTNSLIVNGSLKGYDEFSYGMNFPFEHPQQAMFFVNSKLGITLRFPIVCLPD